MDKGFTVKAKAPTAQKQVQEWDYEKAKQLVKERQ